MRRARDIVGGRYDRAVEAGRHASDRLDDLGVRAADGLYRRADGLIARAFRSERCVLPAREVVDDLVGYTELPREVVEQLLVEREPFNFRSEWHATPEKLRTDHWYYLSARGYLFGNAIHFAGDGELDLIRSAIPAGARILDFGAGAGTFALDMARLGHPVVIDELSAIQRDFVRFRIWRHELSSLVTIVDPWAPIPPGSIDVVTAFDVFEHMADGRDVLRDRLLPALTADGLLIEDSPFVVNLSNPMHHEDWGLATILDEAGFAIRSTHQNLRVWSRTPNDRV